MNRKKIKPLITNICIGIASIFFFLLAGEIICRAFFPEWTGFVFGNGLSYNKNVYTISYNGLGIRVPSEFSELQLAPDDTIIVVLGDSYSAGFGLSYQDIFWQRWQRKFDLKGENIKIISISGYGNNFIDNIESIKRSVDIFKDQFLLGIVYQFNLNDIHPIRKSMRNEVNEENKEIGQKNLTDVLNPIKFRMVENILNSIYDGSSKLRIYLKRSVFYRVFHHVLYKILYSNLNTDCEDLGFDGMGVYTWTFGMHGFEKESKDLWGTFERNISEIFSITSPIPFFIILTPISEMIDPQEHIHFLNKPYRFDCATIDPVKRLRMLCEHLGIHFINPTSFIKSQFEMLYIENNLERFYFIDDDNHLNKTGSEYFAEYTFEEIYSILTMNNK